MNLHEWRHRKLTEQFETVKSLIREDVDLESIAEMYPLVDMDKALYEHAVETFCKSIETDNVTIEEAVALDPLNYLDFIPMEEGTKYNLVFKVSGAIDENLTKFAGLKEALGATDMMYEGDTVIYGGVTGQVVMRKTFSEEFDALLIAADRVPDTSDFKRQAIREKIYGDK